MKNEKIIKLISILIYIKMKRFPSEEEVNFFTQFVVNYPAENCFKENTLYKLRYSPMKLENNPNFLDYLKKRFTKIIEEIISENLPLTKQSVQYIKPKIKNISVAQRRFDSLSRLLFFNSELASCIAVFFVRNKFVITVNSPLTIVIKDRFQQVFNHMLREEILEKKKEIIKNILMSKIKILRNFLLLLKSDLDKKNPSFIILDAAKKKVDKFKPFFYKKIIDTLSLMTNSLMWHPSGGVFVEENNNAKHFLRLSKDLEKISEYAIQGWVTKGEQGFSETQDYSLLQSELFIYFPDAKIENEMRVYVHADQLALAHIVRILNEKPLSTLEKQSLPILIGLPKSCCVVCKDVLNEVSDIVSFRSYFEDGLIFPNSINISTGKIYRKKDITLFPAIKNGRYKFDMAHKDSDSESESKMNRINKK